MASKSRISLLVLLACVHAAPAHALSCPSAQPRGSNPPLCADAQQLCTEIAYHINRSSGSIAHYVNFRQRCRKLLGSVKTTGEHDRQLCSAQLAGAEAACAANEGRDH